MEFADGMMSLFFGVVMIGIIVWAIAMSLWCAVCHDAEIAKWGK